MSTFDFNKYCLEKLFKEIPEILLVTGELKETLDWHMNEVGPLAHLIYEDILSYVVLELINKKVRTNNEQELIDRSFRLIEDLANHEDFEVRCVAEVSFLEPLLDRVEPTKKLISYLHPKSLGLAQHVGQFVFGYNPHTWEKEK